MTNLRVLHVVNSLERGGLERVVYQMALARGALTTSVLCLNEVGVFGRALQESGVQVVALNEPRLGGLGMLSRLCRHLHRTRPNVVHCHNLPALTAGGLASRLCGVSRLIFTKHGASSPGRGRANQLRRWLARSAGVVAVSREIQQSLRRWLPRSSRDVHFIPNGVDLSTFATLPNKQAARRENGYQPKDFVIGVVARLCPEKDHACLLEAFARVSQQLPDAKLMLVGDGPLRSQLEQRIAAMGLAERARLLGDRHDVVRLLSAMDLFVLPSRTEGIPLAVLEAMAAAVPVVASRVGGIPALISHGQTGLLIDAGAPQQLTQAILSVAHDQQLRICLGAAARRFVQAEFDLRQMLARYEQLYQTCS